MPGSARPSSAQNRARSASPWSPKKPSVPTAPPSWPTSQRGRALAQPVRGAGDLVGPGRPPSSPKVTGAPGWPWVRPAMTVSRWRSARSSSSALGRGEVAPRRPPPTLRMRQRRPGVGEVLHGRAVVDVLACLGAGAPAGAPRIRPSVECDGAPGLGGHEAEVEPVDRAAAAIASAAAGRDDPQLGLGPRPGRRGCRARPAAGRRSSKTARSSSVPQRWAYCSRVGQAGAHAGSAVAATRRSAFPHQVQRGAPGHDVTVAAVALDVVLEQAALGEHRLPGAGAGGQPRADVDRRPARSP